MADNPNLSRRAIYRNFAVLFSGNVLARILLVLGMPVLAKFFSPSEIGQWQLFLSMVAILAPFTTWKYEIAFVLPDDEHKASNLLIATVVISITFTVLWMIVFHYLSPTLAGWLKFDFIHDYGWLVPLMACIYALDQCWMFWLTRQNHFKEQVPGRVVQSIAIVSIPILLLLFTQLSVYHLIVGSLVAQLFATAIISYFLFKRTGNINPSALSASSMLEAVSQFKNYPLFVTPYAVLAQVSIRFLIFFLAIFASSYEVGLFAMALQLTLVPVTFVGLSLSKVLYPRFARSLAESETHGIVIDILVLMVLVATPWAVLFVFYSTELMILVLGSRWSEAGVYAAWLTVPSLMLLFTSWLNRIYDVTGRQRLEFLIQIVYSVTLFVAITLVMKNSTDVHSSVKLYSVLTATFYIVWLIIGFKVASFDLVRLLRPLAYLMAITAVTCFVCWVALISSSCLPPFAFSIGIVGLMQFSGFCWLWQQNSIDKVW